MKKLLAVLVLIIGIAAVVLTRCGGGFGLGLGFGTGKGDGDGNMAVNVSVEKVEDSEAPEADNSDESTDESEETILKVTVVENDYFYENEKTRLNTLMDRIKETDGDYVVEIKDEQASKNAYEALIEELKEDGIAYTEK